jgi:hypothetical protein
MLSNRNCFKLLVKMISASQIARCPSFKSLTMQVRLPHLGRGIADRSIRDHHVRRQAEPPQRTNARSDFVFWRSCLRLRHSRWATRAAGYRAAISCNGTKRTCRGRLTMSAPEGKTDVPREPGHFRFCQTGHSRGGFTAEPKVNPAWRLKFWQPWSISRCYSASSVRSPSRRRQASASRRARHARRHRRLASRSPRRPKCTRRNAPFSVFPPFSRTNPGNFDLRMLIDISTALTKL